MIGRCGYSRRRPRFRPACPNGFPIPAIDQATIPFLGGIFRWPGEAGFLVIACRISPAPLPVERGILSFKGRRFRGSRLRPVLAGPDPPPI